MADYMMVLIANISGDGVYHHRTAPLATVIYSIRIYEVLQCIGEETPPPTTTPSTLFFYYS